MTNDNLINAPLLEDLDDDFFTDATPDLMNAVAPARGNKKKKKQHGNPNQVAQNPAPIATPTSHPVEPAPMPAATSTPAQVNPTAVDSVMELFGTIPDVVNDVAALSTTVKTIAPIKPTLIALAIGAAAAAVALITLRGEQ